MAINGGGYTFISIAGVAKLKSSDMKYLFTKKKDVLLRISNKDGSQPYTVIKQYTKTGGLSVQLSTYHGYTRPVNANLGKYIFLGTLKASYAKRKSSQGFGSNDKQIIFHNCDTNPNNYFAFFPNQYERSVSKYLKNNPVYESTGVAVEWRKSAVRPPSGRRMPLNYFLLTEMHYGGCGCYTSSDRWLTSKYPALGTAIGLR